MVTLLRRAHGMAANAKRFSIEGFGTTRSAVVRHRARRQLGDEVPGVTVVTVNWNTLPFLRTLLAAVDHLTPDLPIVVVDNASSDGSREFLRSHDVHFISLPVNVRHGRAVDLGVAAAKTSTVAVVDVDAFPIRHGWLDESLLALDQGAVLSGAYVHRNFIHPSFLVGRRRTLLDVSFRPLGRNPSTSKHRLRPYMDAGEALSQAVAIRHGSRALHRIPITESEGPGLFGSIYGDVVFHNFGTTYGHGRQDAEERHARARARFLPNVDIATWNRAEPPQRTS